MRLSEFCIRRPVFASVLSCILILVGAFCYTQIKTRFRPVSPNQQVVVMTTYMGASQQLVESTVTSPIEAALNGVPGITNIQSNTNQGFSMIQVKISGNANREEVVNQIRDKVNQAHVGMPDNITQSMVLAGGFQNNELMDIAFWSNKRSPSAVRDYLERNFTDKIQQISGVKKVNYEGAYQYAMRIWLDPNKMAALNLSVQDVQTALNQANISQPAEQINSLDFYYPITANTRLKNAAQFNNVLIKNVNGRLKDIGQAKFGVDDREKSFSRLNNKPIIDLQVIYVVGSANPIDIGTQVDKLFEQAKTTLPPDIHYTKIFDRTTWLRDSIHEVYETIGMAILFVSLVVLLFLGSFRASIIPIITIPICLLASIAILFFAGISINMITLLAMVLAVGLIVDDAIVVVENIHRHIEEGLLPFNAALKGIKEISAPVISMTLTLVAVFLPIMFMHGDMAAILKSFVIALASSVLISGFVALTLSPTMASHLLQEKGKQNRYEIILEKLFHGLASSYGKLLSFLLNVRLLVGILVLLIAGAGYYLFQSLPKEYAPQEDIGIVQAFLHQPLNANITSAREKLDTAYNQIKSIPEIAHVADFAYIGQGDNNLQMYIPLVDYKQRHRNATQIANEIRKRLNSIPGLNATVFADSLFNGGWDFGFQFSLLSNDDWPQLHKDTELTIKRLKNYPGLTGLTTNMKFNNQQYEININHLMADKLDVSNKTINNALAIFLGGVESTNKFIQGNKSYDIIYQATKQYQKEISDLSSFYIRNANNKLINLGSVVTIKRTSVIPNLNHYDLQRSATISGTIAPGYSMGQVIQELQTLLPQVIPAGTKYAFINAAQEYLDSNASLAMLFISALIFIYLVLAAQFESFIDPMIILLTVPLSIVSALAALKIFGGSLNIFSEIGLVTLVGLISKHGILITQFANQLCAQGLSVKDAIIKGASLRLRPILMTTAAMIMGAIPLLLASGASANSRKELAIVIIAGLLCGTFFSLIVVPIAYSLLHGLKKNKQYN